MKTVSRPVAVLSLAISALVGISAPVVAVAAVALAEKPAWALFGFEFATLVAAVMGVLFGLGKFRDAPAMALACIAGTIFIAAVLGWASITASAGERRAVAWIPMTPLMVSRVLAAAGLTLAAAYTVLSRQPQAWRPALLGAVLGSPAVIVGAALVNPGTRGTVSGALMTPLGAVIAFVVLGALLAASVHLVIRGFEIGSRE